VIFLKFEAAITMENTSKNKAIVTVCIGENSKRMADLTHPSINTYANKINADFIVINELKCSSHPTFERFQIYDLLETYDRIIWLDTDILINTKCPDLFDIVPLDKIGAFIVTKYSDYHEPSSKKIQEILGVIDWQYEHHSNLLVSFNAGVLVVSSCHREVFDYTSNSLFEQWSYWSGCYKFLADQTLLNYSIQKLRIPIYDIGYKFNHTIAPSNSEQRFNSYIIHYAGISHRDGNRFWKINRLSKIKNDLFIMECKFLNYIVCRFPLLVKLLDWLFDLESFLKQLNLNQVKNITKNILKWLLPSKIHKIYRSNKLARQLEQDSRAFNENLKANFLYDLERFSKYSAAKVRGVISDLDGVITQTNLKALITMDYHRIEKGLALKEPRIAFGSNVIQRLIDGVKAYQELYGHDKLIEISINTLLSYYKFNLERGHADEELHTTIIDLKRNIIEANINSTEGGVSRVTKEDIYLKSKKDLKEFFASRYSIRNFTDEEVNLDLINQAVGMAQKTPSVCNRQSSKVYVFRQEDDKQKVLSLQNGNRGFGDQASKVLIVTSDMQNFASIGERNQCWIDGGMFAMSLIYALHSLGLGTCCLNWSVEHQTDKQLRDIAGISDSEAVIMMIAVGFYPEEISVAQSPRKQLDEVLIIK
jgi:nitroreductase/lipopolysaccharide biosynthesis glycosyltransferase